jgi:hypothetical protein
VAVGNRIRALRLEAGLTRKELAERLGMSEDKVLNVEISRPRLYLGEVLEFARASWACRSQTCWRRSRPRRRSIGSLRRAIPRWLGAHPTASNNGLRRPCGSSAISRGYAGSTPAAVLHAGFPPVQFKAVWQLPVEDDLQRLLYVADPPLGFVGHFFEDAIQPGSDIGQADAPRPADIRDWRTEDELEHYLQAVGYCVQLYPRRSHVGADCRLAHESERAASRAAAGRPQAQSGMGDWNSLRDRSMHVPHSRCQASEDGVADQDALCQTDATWRPPNKRGKMKEMTWTELTAVEPRLEALRAEAAAVDGSDPHFCANRI